MSHHVQENQLRLMLQRRLLAAIQTLPLKLQVSLKVQHRYRVLLLYLASRGAPMNSQVF
jgi:hypothetical protein